MPWYDKLIGGATLEETPVEPNQVPVQPQFAGQLGKLPGFLGLFAPMVEQLRPAIEELSCRFEKLSTDLATIRQLVDYAATQVQPEICTPGNTYTAKIPVQSIYVDNTAGSNPVTLTTGDGFGFVVAAGQGQWLPMPRLEQFTVSAPCKVLLCSRWLGGM